MNIKDLVKEAHQTARDKGWWETPRNGLELAALVHREVSEFVEEIRQDGDFKPGETGIFDTALPYSDNIPRPFGPLVELADAILYIADYCGYMGWDLEDAIEKKLVYNKTREYKHGKKC